MKINWDSALAMAIAFTIGAYVPSYARPFILEIPSYDPQIQAGINYETWHNPVDHKPSKTKLADFLRPNSDWGAGHRGVDFAADLGDTVLAPHNGQIALAGLVFGVPTLVIERSNGSSSVLQPACLGPELATGESVKGGQAIGTVCQGTRSLTHCAIGCLHWGFRLDRDIYLNPLKFLREVSPARLTGDT